MVQPEHIERLVKGEHWNPRELLGPHRTSPSIDRVRHTAVLTLVEAKDTGMNPYSKYVRSSRRAHHVSS